MATDVADAPVVPRPRRAGVPYRVAIVCLGNICRSPMADVVLTGKLVDAGLDRDVDVVSAGTGGWHVGDPMDRRAAALLTAHGYDASAHRVRQFERDWYDECDLVLAMDGDNLTDLTALGPHVEPGRLLMFRDFDPRSSGEHDRDVPDPFYGGDEGFATVLAMVERTCAALVEALARTLDPDRDAQRAGG